MTRNHCFTLLLGLCFSASLFASVQSGADKLINAVDPAINIGMDVFDLTTGVNLYHRNEKRLFIPASNMKLFSDAAALMVLGPDYRFQNTLSVGPSQIREGTLKGDLYLRLQGDPSFDHIRLAQMLDALKTFHIHRIEGHVIIDSSLLHVNAHAPGWMAEDLSYGYGAPIAPLMMDANRVLVTVNPGALEKEPAVVELPEGADGIHVENLVKTQANSRQCGVDLSMDEENHLTVRGCMGVGQWAVMQKVAIRNPLLYAEGLIKARLRAQNIVLEGSVRLGKTPKQAMVIASDWSKPIAQLMADTMKPSDNLYADSLYLHAAAKLKGVPVNWGEAQTLLKQFLTQQTHISLKHAVLTDGSGLSRYDLLSPKQTVKLLRFLHERFPLSYEYISALPVSGRDGTLQKRLKKPNQKDMVRAKTGTMRGVVSLSGYLYTANAHTLAFAIYINNLPGTKLSVSGKYRYLVDALTNYFLSQKPSNNSWAKVFMVYPRINYQQKPTQNEVWRQRYAKWRRLENALKLALQGQAVTVIYHANELVLLDRQNQPQAVLSALEKVQRQYPFAAALFSEQSPQTVQAPLTVWSNHLASTDKQVKRVWSIHEAVI